MPQFRVGDTNKLVSKKNTKICINPNANAIICATLNTNPQRQQVEYRWRWVPNVRGWRWARTVHVQFVSILFALGSQSKRDFQWNTGIRMDGPLITMLRCRGKIAILVETIID